VRARCFEYRYKDEKLFRLFFVCENAFLNRKKYDSKSHARTLIDRQQRRKSSARAAGARDASSSSRRVETSPPLLLLLPLLLPLLLLLLLLRRRRRRVWVKSTTMPTKCPKLIRKRDKLHKIWHANDAKEVRDTTHNNADY